MRLLQARQTDHELLLSSSCGIEINIHRTFELGFLERLERVDEIERILHLRDSLRSQTGIQADSAELRVSARVVQEGTDGCESEVMMLKFVAADVWHVELIASQSLELELAVDEDVPQLADSSDAHHLTNGQVGEDLHEDLRWQRIELHASGCGS